MLAFHVDRVLQQRSTECPLSEAYTVLHLLKAHELRFINSLWITSHYPPKIVFPTVYTCQFTYIIVGFQKRSAYCVSYSSFTWDVLLLLVQWCFFLSTPNIVSVGNFVVTCNDNCQIFGFSDIVRSHYPFSFHKTVLNFYLLPVSNADFTVLIQSRPKVLLCIRAIAYL